MALSPLAFSVTSAGLTIASTNYSNGDTLGTLISVPNAVASAGGFGYLRNLRINDYADIVSSVTMFLFRDSVTLAADNAAWAVSDADSDQMIDQLMVPLVDNGANRQGAIRPQTMFDCVGTTLYIGLRADSIGAAFFTPTTGATDLRIRGWIDRVT
jgi:hypothetical protein